MSVFAIEINDCGLLAGNADGWRDAGAGYALVDDGRILVGDEARSQARLRPREVHNRFWRDLGTSASSPGASPADLACEQLRQVWQESGRSESDAAIFIVPGYFDRQALGLLLGIAGEAGIPARGLVDAAVAAAVSVPGQRAVLHLDIHLHASLVTEIQADDRFRRGELQVSDGLGLTKLEQSWIAAIAEAFVRQTRFDPLHHASTEQLLFERLWGWLEAIGESSELEMQLEYGDRRLNATITVRQLLDAVEPQYQRLVRLVESLRASRGIDRLQLTHRTASLPGLVDLLKATTAAEIQSLEPAASVIGAVARSEHILSEADAVRFVTTLPRTSSASAERVVASPDDDDGRSDPTHLLQGAVAFLISEVPLEIGMAPSGDHRQVVIRDQTEGVSRSHCLVYRKQGDVVVEDASRYGTFVNDRRVSGSAVLRAGDVLRIGSPGSRLLLVEERG
jgi:molecular chaperone DnaK (HSP70)